MSVDLRVEKLWVKGIRLEQNTGERHIRGESFVRSVRMHCEWFSADQWPLLDTP